MIRKIYKIKATVALFLKVGSDFDLLNMHCPFCYFKCGTLYSFVVPNPGWDFPKPCVEFLNNSMYIEHTVILYLFPLTELADTPILENLNDQ